jgi:hypothetical protein
VGAGGGGGEGREVRVEWTERQCGEMEGSEGGWWGRLHSYVSVLNG